MKIVKFDNGTYGLRRRVVTGYEFFDFENNYWWATIGNYSGHTKECQVKSLYDLQNALDRGTVVQTSAETQEIVTLLKYLWAAVKKKFKL